METGKSLSVAAKIISFLSHPLLIPSLGCIVIFNSGYYVGLLNPKIMQAVYIVVFVLTFLLPALIIPALYLQKYITSFVIEERNERLLPLSIVAVMYGLSYYFMQRSGFPPILLHFILGCIICLVLGLIITIKWKISLHMIGLGGLTGLIAFLSHSYGLGLHYFLIFAFIVAGLTGTARLILGCHIPSQIYAGYFLGIAGIWFSMLLF